MTTARQTLATEEWKDLVQRGRAPREVLLRKAYACELGGAAAQGYPLGPRDIGLVISTEAPDREHDVIKADGWQLANYRKNPVVMYAHDYRSLPIARAKHITVGQGTLRVVDEFATADINPMAETIFQLIKHNFLNAASVGFQPLKWSINEERGGFDFEETELLEHSIVPVPAHPEALVEARSLGFDLSRLGAPAAWAGLRDDEVVLELADDERVFTFDDEPRGSDFDPEQVRQVIGEALRTRIDRALGLEEPYVEIEGGLRVPARELAAMVGSSIDDAVARHLCRVTGRLD